MFATSFISSGKIWLTVCVAVMMSFATVIPDIHLVDPDEIACQDEVSSVKASNEKMPNQPSKAPHEHHAHNCGSCHIHVTSLQTASIDDSMPVARAGYNLNAFDAPPRAGPMGLYRPPRA